MHPKDKGCRRFGGEGCSSSSTGAAATGVPGGRRKLFSAYMEKDRGVRRSKTDEISTTTSKINGSDSGTAYVNIGSNNVRRWELLKDAQGYTSDSDFATSLLDGLAGQTSTKSTVSSNKETAVIVDDGEMKGGSSIGDPNGSSRDDESSDQSTVNDGSGTMDVKQNGDDGLEAVDESEITYGDDRTDESGESMSDDEKDLEWTPASFLCETQFTRQHVGVGKKTKMRGLRRSRRRTKATSKSKFLQKRSSTVGKLSADKKVRGRQSTCIDCSEKHVNGECPLRGPSTVVVDTITDKNVCHSLAEATLPKMLKFETIDKSHGPSVVALENIFQYTQFGPLVGERIKEPDIQEDMDLKHIWEIFGSNLKLYVDTSDKNKSNWLRFVRPAMWKNELNVSVIAKEDQLYFITTKNIEAGTELNYWVEDPTWSWSKATPVKTICQVCNKRFCHPLYYRMHCVIFHDPNCGYGVRKFRCKICGITILGRDALRQHASEMHGGKGAYQCEYCKKFLLRLHSLEAHRMYSCKLNPRRCRPLCDLCGKEFSFPQKLKVHMRRMHSDNSEILKEFQCKSCSKLMSSRACLQRHINEVHAMNEVATCDRCGKTFQNKSNLKIHMLTHSGVKPFRCTASDCTAAFTTKQCLQFHYKKAHGYTTGNMPAIERCVAYTFENYAGGEEAGGEEAAGLN